MIKESRYVQICLEFVRSEYMGNRESKGCIYRCNRVLRCRGVSDTERVCKR